MTGSRLRGILTVVGLFLGPATQAATPAEAADRFLVERWTTADGLPQNSITDMVQDEQGYLWLTTFGGLARFDGTHFTVFDMASRAGLDSSRFLSVLPDASGDLWLGTERRGLLRLTDGAFASTSDDPLLATAGIGGLVQHDEAIWAASGDGLFRVHEGRVERFGADAGLTGDAARAVSSTPGGDLWVGTPRGALCWTGPTCEPLEAWRPPEEPERGPRAVYGFATDLDGELWAIGEAGLQLLGADRAWELVEPAQSHSYVGDVVADPATGRVWFSDGPELLLRERTGEVLRVPLVSPLRPDEAATYPIRSLLLDREGALWVGVDGAGLFHVRDRRIRRHGAREGLPDPSVRTVLDDPATGRLWVGSGCAALHWLEDGRFSTRTLPEPKAGCVRALALGADGALFFGGGPRLYRLRGEELSWFDERHGLPRADVLSILPREDGSLLLGTGGAGVYRFQDGQASRAFADAGLDADRVPVLVADGDEIWVGSDRGVTRLGSGPARHLGAEQGLSPGAVRDILLDPDGTAWIGTYGGGLTRVREGRLDRFTRARGLCDDVVSRILDGGDGALWMNGNRGLFRVPRDAFDAALDDDDALLPCVLLESGEGNGGASPAGVRGEDGRLWLPTIVGVVEVDPATVDLGLVDPLVSIEQATLDGVPLDLEAENELPPGRRDLVVHFVGLDFTAPGELRFRHRLLGHDETWADAGSARVARYAGLPPGVYRFEVQARSARGGLSRVASVDLTLVPSLWERSWFPLAAALALLLAVSGLWWRRLQGVARSAAALQAEVSARKELAEQLRQAQKAEAMGQLAGGVAHDFNNVLVAVVGFAELLRHRVTDRQALEYLDHLLASARRGEALAQRLLDLGRQQEVAPEALDLTEVIEGLRPMLRQVLPASISLSIEQEGNAPPVRLDRVDLDLALLNLVVNARDAMPDGGDVVVSLSPARLGAAEATARGVPEGDWAVLAITDTGEGMNTALQRQVFEPFFTTKTDGLGTGLGLATVQRVVREAGGFLTLDSRPGEGSTFRLWFPAVG